MISLNKNNEALNIINHAIDLDNNCSEAYNLKGYLYIKFSIIIE